MPEIMIIAGPNGAGKTSFIRAADWSAIIGSPSVTNFELLNADEIEKELAAGEFKAGRVLLQRLDEHVAAKNDIVLETTLSGTNYLTRIPGWQDAGYRVTLIYLRFASVEQTIARVARRVAFGGHDIPEQVQRQRFGKSLRNLSRFQNAADAWYVFDWSSDVFRLSETSETL